MLLLQIFLSFFKIGIISFGGGYAMIPLIEREIIEVQGWLTSTEFLDIIAVAEMTPGPIAINSATYIGYTKANVLGSAVATFGVVLPSFMAMVILAYLINKTKHLPHVKGALRGIVSGVIALIGFATFRMAVGTGLATVDLDLPSVLVSFNIYNIFICIGAFFLLHYTKFHPVLLLISFGILGIIVF